jgi:tRNA(Arg) A34 adenosine deaminase TadA
MRQALEAARESAAQGEVPVGAVLVRRQAGADDAVAVELLACTHNQPIGLHDPTAHAEMLALRQAAARLGNYRLDDCDLYVTLEPCAMCAQAILHARIRRVIYGAREPKTGAAGSVLDLFSIKQLNHQTEVVGGVLADECAALMQEFFAGRRRAAKRAAVPLRDDALRAPEQRFDSAWRRWPGLKPTSRYELELPALQRLRLHYLDMGPETAGKVWLALHGPDGWWPQMADWASARVEQGDRVLLPDLIGFGQSDKPKKPGWHSLGAHACLLLDWLPSLHINAFGIAHAPGQAMLAQALLQTAPRRAIELNALQTEQLTDMETQLRQAPYPDAGHEAGPRAWRSQGWDAGIAHQPG